MEQKRLVIYHANCVDGFTAAWACWRKFGDDAEYFAAQYNVGWVKLPDTNGRDVVMVDFCTSRDQLTYLKTMSKSLLVLDHHESAREACAGLDFCIFDMNRSGAGLAWDHFHSEELLSGGSRPWLISYVEDRDLWRWQLSRSKEVSAYLATLPFEFSVWEELHETGSPTAAANKGLVALALIQQQVDRTVKGARELSFLGHRGVPVVNVTANISEVVGHLADSAYFAVGWFQSSDGRFVYSLRSRGSFDVQALAKTMGGGGHKQAAGFTSLVPPEYLTMERKP